MLQWLISYIDPSSSSSSRVLDEQNAPSVIETPPSTSSSAPSFLPLASSYNPRPQNHSFFFSSLPPYPSRSHSLPPSTATASAPKRTPLFPLYLDRWPLVPLLSLSIRLSLFPFSLSRSSMASTELLTTETTVTPFPSLSDRPQSPSLIERTTTGFTPPRKAHPSASTSFSFPPPDWCRTPSQVEESFVAVWVPPRSTSLRIRKRQSKHARVVSEPLRLKLPLPTVAVRFARSRTFSAPEPCFVLQYPPFSKDKKAMVGKLSQRWSGTPLRREAFTAPSKRFTFKPPKMGNLFASSPPKKDNDEERDALDAQNPIPDDISIKALDQLDEASLPDKPVLLDTIEQLVEMQHSPANEEAAKEVDLDQAEEAKKTDITPSEFRPSSAPQPNTVDGVSSSVFYLVNKTMQGRGLPNLKLVLTDDEGDIRGQGAVYCWREVIEAACPALIDAVSDDGVLFLDAIDDHPPPPASKKTIVRTPWPKEARDYFHAAASVAIEPGQDVPFPLIRTLSAPDVEPAHTKMTKGKVPRPKSVQQSGSGVRRPLETIRKGKTATARVWADLSSQPIAPLTPVVQPAKSNVAADRFDERVIVSEPATPKEGRRFRALSFGAASARAQKWKKHLRIVSGAPEATGSVVDGAQSLATSALSTPADTPLPSGMVFQQSQDGQRHRHGSQSSGGHKRPPSMASVSAGQVVHGELIAVTGCSFETLQALIFYLK